MTLLGLTALTLGALGLLEVYGSAGKPAGPQAGGCGPAFTAITYSGAGTGMLQGTTVTSINTEGDVAGIYITAPNIAHGFVRPAATGTITTFDAPGAGTTKNQGTFVTGIDAAGDVSGIYADSNNAYHGFVRASSTGVITPFDVPGAPTGTGHRGTSPTSINASGTITGLYSDANSVRHGFLRSSSGSFTTFDVSAAGMTSTEGTIPIGINAGGDVTGFYLDASHVSHGFIRAASTGTITAPIDAPGSGKLPSKGGFSFGGTTGVGIDTGGDIVGIYADANFVYHGYVRTASGTITQFDVTGVAATGLFPGTLPTSMNGAGDVAGFYTDASGVNHAFVRSFATGTITAPLDAAGASTTGMFTGTVPFGINSSEEIAGIYADMSGVFHGFVATTSGTAATPTFSPAPGTYSTAQSVTISDATAGAVIYYTTDGTPPTTSSTVYTGPIAVTATETIEAIAVANGCSNSSVATATYTIESPAPTPTISPAPGTYTSVQTVTISDTAAGATIYYTTNGTTPTTASNMYTGPITVNSTETIEAIATVTGFASSAVATAAYVINLPAAATPMFSPAGGTYTSAQTVTISDTTAGATIYYTTDGSTPTTGSTKFTAPIPVGSTETINAIAAAPGFSNSAVATAVYTLPTPDFQVSVNPTTLTIVAGQSGQAVFTVTPLNGFNSKVSLACNGLPTGAACTFNPSSVTPNGMAASTTTLTVSTTAPSAALHLPAPSPQQLAYAFAFPILALLFGIGARRRPAFRGVRLVAFLALLVVASGLASCSGSSGGNTGTPVGTDMVSVSASANVAAPINHSATLTITITH